jgi:hypothetical protein
VYASNSPSGLPFCDEVQNNEDSYDRNDNPEEYCVKYGGEDEDFCELIGDICDADGSVKLTDPYCKDGEK